MKKKIFLSLCIAIAINFVVPSIYAGNTKSYKFSITNNPNKIPAYSQGPWTVTEKYTVGGDGVISCDGGACPKQIMPNKTVTYNIPSSFSAPTIPGNGIFSLESPAYKGKDNTTCHDYFYLRTAGTPGSNDIWSDAKPPILANKKTECK